MSIGRRILLWACAVIVPVSLVTIVGVGSAAATKGPSFSGAAVGTVTCIGVNVKLSFSPPAKLSSGGNSATIKGKFSGCHVTNTPAGPSENRQPWGREASMAPPPSRLSTLYTSSPKGQR